LVVRWVIYGLLAYLAATWLGGSGSLRETLGVLAVVETFHRNVSTTPV